MLFSLHGAVVFAFLVVRNHALEPSLTDRANLADVFNPDRGIYKHTETRASSYEPLYPSELQKWRDNEAISLVYRTFVLDTFTSKDITASHLTTIRNDLEVIKSASLKAIVRFCYSLDSSKDASRTQALRHIVQIAPIIKDYASIISVVQAGFIGKFGEWYYTDNMETSGDRVAILDALIAAVPKEIMVQVRVPAYKQEKCGTNTLTTQTALTGTTCARIGLYNDCFLGTYNDKGTFRWNSVAADQAYFATESLYTVVGGETCEPNAPRTSCSNALTEIKKYHYTFLNKDWNGKVVNGWINAGCYPNLKSTLGYRYQMDSVSVPTTVTRGRTATFKVTITNTGAASLFNAYLAEVILRSTTTSRSIPQPSIDARKWAAGATNVVSATITVPTDLPVGSYEVLLNIYDAKRPTIKYGRIVVINSGVATSDRYNKLGTTTVA